MSAPENGASLTTAEDEVPPGCIATPWKMDKVYLCDVPNLSKDFPSSNATNDTIAISTSGEPSYWNKLIGPDECIMITHIVGPGKKTVSRFRKQVTGYCMKWAIQSFCLSCSLAYSFELAIESGSQN
ncbi:unnamed protein product [Phaeothamnion confervicola]